MLRLGQLLLAGRGTDTYAPIMRLQAALQGDTAPIIAPTRYLLRWCAERLDGTPLYRTGIGGPASCSRRTCCCRLSASRLLQVQSALVYRRDDGTDLALVKWVMSQSPPAVPTSEPFAQFANTPEAMKEFSGEAIKVMVSLSFVLSSRCRLLMPHMHGLCLRLGGRGPPKPLTALLACLRGCFASKHPTSLWAPDISSCHLLTVLKLTCVRLKISADALPDADVQGSAGP